MRKPVEPWYAYTRLQYCWIEILLIDAIGGDVGDRSTLSYVWTPCDYMKSHLTKGGIQVGQADNSPIGVCNTAVGRGGQSTAVHPTRGFPSSIARTEEAWNRKAKKGTKFDDGRG